MGAVAADPTTSTFVTFTVAGAAFVAAGAFVDPAPAPADAPAPLVEAGAAPPQETTSVSTSASAARFHSIDGDFRASHIRVGVSVLYRTE